MKSQTVRLLDVFVVGPYMMAVGVRTRDDFLTILGALTVIYNGLNYMAGER